MNRPRPVLLVLALLLAAALAVRAAEEDEATVALKKELAEANAQIADLNAKLAEVLAVQDQLRERLTRRTVELDNAVKQIEELTKRLDEALAPLHKIKEAPTDRIVRGKVKSVDKKTGTVVLDVGDVQKVKKGWSFIVFRGDIYVGKVIVDEVRADDSTAHFDNPSMKGDPQPGDDVTTKLVIEL